MKNTAGFTLVEISVVLAIIGVLTAIALPSFLNHVSNSQETEARKNLAVVLRLQQEFYQEHGAFALSWDELATGLPATTNNYTYEVFPASGHGSGVLINQRSEDLRSYLGGIKAVTLRQETRFAVARCVAIKRGDVLRRDSLLVGEYQVRCGRRVNEIK